MTAFLLPLLDEVPLGDQRTYLRTFCFSWKQSDEVGNGCSPFWLQLHPHFTLPRYRPLLSSCISRRHDVTLLSAVFSFSLPPVGPSRLTASCEQGWPWAWWAVESSASRCPLKKHLQNERTLMCLFRNLAMLRSYPTEVSFTILLQMRKRKLRDM